MEEVLGLVTGVEVLYLVLNVTVVGTFGLGEYPGVWGETLGIVVGIQDGNPGFTGCAGSGFIVSIPVTLVAGKEADGRHRF